MKNIKTTSCLSAVTVVIADGVAGLALSVHAAPATPVVLDLAPASAQETHPILTGKMPSCLQLATIDRKHFSLDASIKARRTVLVLYRGGWRPFCNMHLAALQGIVPQLTQLGYQILDVSPDPGSELKATVYKHALTYTLLTATSMSALKAFGLAYRVDATMLTQPHGHGVDLETRTGMRPAMLPVPAAYVLDTDGNVHFAYANPDFKTRVDTGKLLQAAEDAVK